jgi:hypothetical protein
MEGGGVSCLPHVGPVAIGRTMNRSSKKPPGNHGAIVRMSGGGSRGTCACLFCQGDAALVTRWDHSGNEYEQRADGAQGSAVA